MNFNLIPYAVVWGLLALTVLTLIVVRRSVATGEDDTLHVMEGDAGRIPQQREIAQKLEAIDKWGKSLTVVALVFGLVLGGLWVYQGWVNASNYMAH